METIRLNLFDMPRGWGPIRRPTGLKPTSTTGLATDRHDTVAGSSPRRHAARVRQREQVGLPVGMEHPAGPGSGGGVGGSGRGGPAGRTSLVPAWAVGLAAAYARPGGSVTAPRVIRGQVRHTRRRRCLKDSGTVVLELVVQRLSLRHSHCSFARSGRTGRQAVLAASQWRFEPGRLAGKPVDVLVTIMLNFWIR